MLRLILISWCLVHVTDDSFGQKRKRLFGSKKQQPEVQTPPDTIVIDGGSLELDQAYLDSLELVELNLDGIPPKEEEPTLMLSYDTLVQVSENLKIDSIWLSNWKYFATWSSTRLNPYQVDGEKFTDSLKLPLIYDNPNLGWHAPIPKLEVTSPFGLRRWKWHYGDDFRLKTGDTIRVSFDGIVRIAHYDRYGYGHYILVRHYNGLETLYGHLKKRLVKVGDIVASGQTIGLGGNTGRSTAPHLHYEVRYEGNAIEPKNVLDFESGTLRSDSLKINPSTFAYLTEARKIRYHRVRSGDTLGHISYRYGVSINTICRINRISRNSILRIGQRLRIT